MAPSPQASPCVFVSDGAPQGSAAAGGEVAGSAHAPKSSFDKEAAMGALNGSEEASLGGLDGAAKGSSLGGVVVIGGAPNGSS